MATVTTPKIEPTTPLKTPDVSNIPVTEPKIEKPEVGTDFNKRLEDLTATIEGRTKESDIKVATASEQRELNEINLQIRMHQAASLKTEEEALEKGETLSFASGESARIARNNAVRALELSAIAQAKQGNLALATDLAGSAIDEKYKKQEQDLRIQRANIVNNYDSFSGAQKKRADALLLRLDKDDAFVKEQKDKEKALTDIGNKAAVAGAPISAVREALATGDVIKANSLLAPFLREKLDTSVVEANGRKLLINNQTGQTIKDLGVSDKKTIAGGLGGVSSLSQSVIDNPSLFYNFTPTQKAQIVSELQGAGYDISQLQNVKLTAGQQDDIAQMNTVGGSIDEVLAFNADGKLEGIGSFGRGTLKSLAAQAGFGGEEGKTVRTLIGNIKGTIAKLRGGTSFTENEEKLLNTYTPSINDDPAVAVNKLHNLKDFIARKNADLLKAAQANITTGQIKKKDEKKSGDLRTKYNY